MKACWITWENHRRSRELAKALDVYYVPILGTKFRPLRYFLLGIKTIFWVAKNRPKVVFCQNPSIILNFILCFLKRPFKFKLITDRHSNFKLWLLDSPSLKWKTFHRLSKFTVKHSDLVIVTNEYLKNLVEQWEGKGFVLPDKLPDMSEGLETKLAGINYVFVSTFSDDEPIMQIVEAARDSAAYNFFITGNYKNYPQIDNLLGALPPNVTLTGFLSEDDYQSLLRAADVVIVLTDMDFTLTCGAYEAVALGKPMILSDTGTIRDYFSAGAIYTDLDATSIKAAINSAALNLDQLAKEVDLLKPTLIENWNTRFLSLRHIVETL